MWTAVLVPPPDLVLPGQSRVVNELVFEDGPAFAESQLVAAPVRGLQGVARVVPGRAVAFSGKYGTRLYALPLDAPLPAEGDPTALAQWPSAPPPVTALWSVAATSPIAKVVTTCRFEGVRDGRVELSVVRQARLDAAGTPVHEGTLLVLLLAISAAGAIGLWRVGRARRATGSA